MLSIYDPKNVHYGACSLFHIRGTLDIGGISWLSPADYIYRGFFLPDSPEHSSLKNVKEQKDLSTKFAIALESLKKSLIKGSLDEYINNVLLQHPEAKQALLNTGTRPIAYSSSDGVLGAKLSFSEIENNEYEMKEVSFQQEMVASDAKKVDEIKGLINAGKIQYIKKGASLRRKVPITTKTFVNIGDTLFNETDTVVVNKHNIAELQKGLSQFNQIVRSTSSQPLSQIVVDSFTNVEVGDVVVFFSERREIQNIKQTGVKQNVTVINGLNLLGSALELHRQKLRSASADSKNRYLSYKAYSTLTSIMLQSDDPFIDNFIGKAETLQELVGLLPSQNYSIVSKADFEKGAYEYPYREEPNALSADEMIRIVLKERIKKAKKNHEYKVVRMSLEKFVKERVLPNVGGPHVEDINKAYSVFLRGISGSKLQHMRTIVENDLSSYYSGRLFTDDDVKRAQSDPIELYMSTHLAIQAPSVVKTINTENYVVISGGSSDLRIFEPNTVTNTKINGGEFLTMSHFLKIDVLYNMLKNTLSNEFLTSRISAAMSAMPTTNIAEWIDKVDNMSYELIRKSLIQRCEIAVNARFQNPLFIESLLVTRDKNLLWNDPEDSYLGNVPAEMLMNIRKNLTPSKDKSYLDAFVWNYVDHLSAQIRFVYVAVSAIFPNMTKNQIQDASAKILTRGLPYIDSGNPIFPPEWLHEPNDMVRGYIMSKANLLGTLKNVSIESKMTMIEIAEYLSDVGNYGVSSERYAADAVITIANMLKQVSRGSRFTIGENHIPYIYSILLGKAHDFALYRLGLYSTKHDMAAKDNSIDPTEYVYGEDGGQFGGGEDDEDDGPFFIGDNDGDNVAGDNVAEEGEQQNIDTHVFGIGDATYNPTDLKEYVVKELASKSITFTNKRAEERLVPLFKDIKSLKDTGDKTLSARIAFFS